MQNKERSPQSSKDSGVRLLIVGVLSLAVGLGIGYYFGKSVGSSEMPTVSSAPSDANAPAMDEATFRQRETEIKSQLFSNPKDVDALIRLGNLYYDNKKYEAAIESYGKALDIDPSNVDVRTDRGTCFWNLQRTDEAIAEFQKSLQINPSHPQTLFNLGIVYLHGKNDMAEARKAWEKLLATNPNYPDRDRLQQMLASMGASTQTSAMPSAPPPSGQSTPGSTASMEDLFRRMKK